MPVVLLCHCDGTNGSTTFTDAAPIPHTLTATLATVSTTSPKFGTGSADFTPGPGAFIDTNNAADFNLGSGQFTVEVWAYFMSNIGLYAVISQWDSASNNGWWLGMNSNVLTFFYSPNGSSASSLTASYTPTLNTWAALAVDRDASNVLRLYVNGAVLNSVSASGTIFASTQTCYIGNDHAGLTRAFQGRLDEARITIGLAQYAGAYTPATGPFGGAAPVSQTRAMVLA